MTNEYKLNRVVPFFRKMLFGTRIRNIITSLNDLQNTMVVENRLLAGIPAVIDGSSTTTKLRLEGPIRYQIGGEQFYSPAAEAVMDSDGQDVTTAKFGAWRMQIDRAGVLTTTASHDTTDMAYESAELALLALANNPLVANTVVVGYCVVESNDGFTIGTDLPITADAHATAVTYYDELGDTGVVTPLSVLEVSGTDEELSLGTATVKLNGARVTEIAVDTTFPFALADTITKEKFGGWLVVSDFAGTSHFLLSADGDTTASLQAYADFGAVKTALDALEAAMPGLFCVLGRFTLANGDKDPWTAITDDIIDGEDVLDSTFARNAANSGLQKTTAAAVLALD